MLELPRLHYTATTPPILQSGVTYTETFTVPALIYQHLPSFSLSCHFPTEGYVYNQDVIEMEI